MKSCADFGNGQDVTSTSAIDIAGHDITQTTKDIKTCQGQGKKIVLSIGGADGHYGFSSSSDAQRYRYSRKLTDHSWAICPYLLFQIHAPNTSNHKLLRLPFLRASRRPFVTVVIKEAFLLPCLQGSYEFVFPYHASVASPHTGLCKAAFLAFLRCISEPMMCQTTTLEDSDG